MHPSILEPIVVTVEESPSTHFGQNDDIVTRWPKHSGPVEKEIPRTKTNGIVFAKNNQDSAEGLSDASSQPVRGGL